MAAEMEYWKKITDMGYMRYQDVKSSNKYHVKNTAAHWNDFHASLNKYQQDTYQIFRQRTSTSVEKRNAEIMATYMCEKILKDRFASMCVEMKIK
ncbi:hypothetical protein PHMEG_00029211 [Phytophthora megakarya]|uniref:Uncharacterized protein n=1 Tax=Phytophthora megakarya TaxID=4795 RepID=A0A225V2L7_9STRA|nr:hypothetical protein PHMEG_00029211 [Phytophthora megakarya]